MLPHGNPNLDPSSGEIDERAVFEQGLDDFNLMLGHLNNDAELGVTFKVDFHKYRKQHGFDHNAYESPDFWRVVSKYADQVEGDDFAARAFRLTLATPKALIDEARLNGDISTSGMHESYDDARLRMSRYHALLEDVVEAKPDLSYSALKGHLEAIAVDAITDDRVAAGAENVIRGTLHGMRHELAVGQALQHLQQVGRRDFRRATPAQDLSGIDYSVRGSRMWFGIDTKASTYKIQDAAAAGKVFGIDGNHVILFSGIPDHLFGDGFYLSEDDTATLAAHLDRTFDVIEDTLLENMDPQYRPA